ncbi:unnamed protein product [Urochloa decumbens]|uniref:Uncharacterized protein n=1 Tax=Urochloa decumbens TaxID=240449 RepID=A0ABC9E057_9POAL
MDRLQAAPANPAVPYGVDEIHYHGVVSVLHARRLAWRLGYLCVALPVMALSAGLLDGPWTAGFAFVVVLLGIASTWSAMLPPRLLARVRRQVMARAAFGNDNNHEVASPESAMAWCGYVLMAASVLGSSLGLVGTPGAALVAHTLLLLGFASISIAMLPLRPMERFLLESESRAVRNSNGNGIVPRADGMDWTGYFFVAAPVLASWAGLVTGPAAAIFAFALLLLGVVFIIIAMRALAKPKMD